MTDGILTMLREMVNFYLKDNRPVGIVVSDDVILAQARKAAKYYLGFGELDNAQQADAVDGNTTLRKSEWAVIMPLFELYVERENALILESSRALGISALKKPILI